MAAKNIFSFKLIVGTDESHHVSLDTVKEFEDTILLNDDLYTVTIVKYKIYIKKISFKLWQINKRYFTSTVFKKYWNYFYDKILYKNKNEIYFAVLMGEDWRKCFPNFICHLNKSIYLFDVWSSDKETVINFVKALNIKHVFLSASQSVQMFQDTDIKGRFFWIPEGIYASIYKFNLYDQKNIDVLALGRKFEKYHNNIVDFLEQSHKIYLYEKKPGELIFASRQSFIDGLARTKISICAPSSITHPERSGNIETMTIRYLQSFVSKCLVLGHAPDEMVGLFGYNPVIEINYENPTLQLQTILDNFDDYIPLIEKNYAVVLENHTWRNRWQQIVTILESQIA
jgi:glycosyltransferase involved in cell wall biosynthesis